MSKKLTGAQKKQTGELEKVSGVDKNLRGSLSTRDLLMILHERIGFYFTF